MSKSILNPCPTCKSRSVYGKYLQGGEFAYTCAECNMSRIVYAASRLEADQKYNDMVGGASKTLIEEALEKRLDHLLESKYIAQFDEINPETGEYKLPIEDADKAAVIMHDVSESMPQLIYYIVENMPQLIDSIIAKLPQMIESEIEKSKIIRCKDCVWFGKYGCAIDVVDERDKPKEDDFCSFAERKKNESE